MDTQTSHEGAFANPPEASAQAFRAAMRAMARPGTIAAIAGAKAPAPFSEAAASLLLTVCDPDTSLYLAGAHDNEATRAWISFHIGAPLAAAAHADFAVGTWEALQPVSAYKVGVAEYPDRAATLIVEMPALETNGVQISGPGIKDTAKLNLPEVDAFRTNRRLFPLGFDCFFTSGQSVAALPRSTRVSDPSTEEAA